MHAYAAGLDRYVSVALTNVEEYDEIAVIAGAEERVTEAGSVEDARRVTEKGVVVPGAVAEAGLETEEGISETIRIVPTGLVAKEGVRVGFVVKPRLETEKGTPAT